MRSTLATIGMVWLLAVPASSILPGCGGCSGTITTGDGSAVFDGGRLGGGDGGGGLNLDALGGGIVIAPADTTVNVPSGGPAATVTFTAMAMTDKGVQDITNAAAWLVDDAAIGTMSGPTFTSSTTQGGTTQVRAIWENRMGIATVHVKLHTTLVEGCPNCPALPDPGGMDCGAGTAPTLVYPPDGVLLPPNMNVFEVQFVPGTGTTVYEIDFENDSTDVRVVTACNPIKDTRGQTTGGCGYLLSQMAWDLVSKSNRGGQQVKVSVRASTQQGHCASPSAATNVLFAEEDLNGGLYYWQSLVVGGVAGKTGGIYRYDFGKVGAKSEPFLTPSQGRCVGCHFLSRDGQRMTFGTDDADSDDEYRDLSAHLLEVASKAIINTSSPGGGGKPIPPGFQTFTHDHKRLLASQGESGGAMSFFQYDGEAGGASNGMAATQQRGTQPDWSANDASVVYVVPKKFANQFNPNPYNRADDDHFLGGSLFTMTFDPASGAFGASQPLVTSMGENNYYPSYSPDTPASFVVFNRADAAELSTDLLKDAFNNPFAKVWLISTKAGSAPLEAKRLNDSGPSTNSWPRWSPFVQMYHGQKLLWVTFSSTRDYGLRVRNHVKVPDDKGQKVDQINCYPPDSPQNPGGSHQQPLPPNCNQPQIWMGAINLTTAEFGGVDPSYPAFWLPFQEVGAHNHIAQWTEQVVTKPGCVDGGVQDAGACIADSQPCGANVCGICCGSLVCSMGTCQMTIP